MNFRLGSTSWHSEYFRNYNFYQSSQKWLSKKDQPIGLSTTTKHCPPTPPGGNAVVGRHLFGTSTATGPTSINRRNTASRPGGSIGEVDGLGVSMKG